MEEKIIIRRVDKFGRILLPSQWRKKYVKKSNIVSIKIEGKRLIIEPMEESSLTEFFDSIEIDVDTEAFKDYNKLKKALLGD